MSGATSRVPRASRCSKCRHYEHATRHGDLGHKSASHIIDSQRTRTAIATIIIAHMLPAATRSQRSTTDATCDKQDDC